MQRVNYDSLKQTYIAALVKRNMESQPADMLASAFADMAWDGTYSHGIYRFPVFIKQVDEGMIKLNNQPICVNKLSALEQWDCQLGPGPLNGIICSQRSIELAEEYGVGVVAMRNSNHWMRGGAYALKVAREGYACIAATNSTAVMPAWGGKDTRLGTNPLIIGIPGNPPTLLDMSCSQYSYGALEVAKVAGKTLEVDGGYDAEGRLSRDPDAISQTRRLLPAGYWKGASLSIVLDMLVFLLADGHSTVELTQDIGAETAISQMFITLNINKTTDQNTMQEKLARTIKFVLDSKPINEDACIQIPGHSIEKFIKDHEENGGMPVDEKTWNTIQSL